MYRGNEVSDPDTIHVVMYTPSMEVIKEHRKNEAERIAAAGGDNDPETMSMSIE